MFTPVFALNKGSSLYQEADFETHFSAGTSPDRPLYYDPIPGGHLAGYMMEVGKAAAPGKTASGGPSTPVLT